MTLIPSVLPPNMGVELLTGLLVSLNPSSTPKTAFIYLQVFVVSKPAVGVVWGIRRENNLIVVQLKEPQPVLTITTYFGEARVVFPIH